MPLFSQHLVGFSKTAKNELYAFSVQLIYFAVKSFYMPMCAPIQMGISPSVLRTFHSIRRGAAKNVKTVQILNYEKALLRISVAQAGQSLCRNRLLCTQTSCISRQRGLL